MDNDKEAKKHVESNILLLDIPLMIINKYKGKTKDGKLLPILSNQKMNAYLKEIADLCGIRKRLTYHLARHTFATMMLSKGGPVESVSKMLGHTNIKTTQIYARITNTATVKIEVQLRHRHPSSLERSGKGDGWRWKPGMGHPAIQNKKGDRSLPRINYFCIVYEI